jgi:hypothetical protein
MSLGIAFKGPEGIVLAADSRVTLTAQLQPVQPQLGQNQPQPQTLLLPATYDNATKLLRVSGQDFVGAVTYGLGALGQQEPRTAHSLMPEFEAELRDAEVDRLTVTDFATKLSEFFLRRWQLVMPSDYHGPDMAFLVGGYDDGAPYGKVLEFYIPTRPSPTEQNADGFGMVWGGQKEFTDRIVQGFDDRLPSMVLNHLGLPATQEQSLRDYLKSQLQARIPFAFLPLQDCVDLSMALIQITIALQSWLVDVRGVGGAIDIAIITRTAGFQPIKLKSVSID